LVWLNLRTDSLVCLPVSARLNWGPEHLLMTTRSVCNRDRKRATPGFSWRLELHKVHEDEVFTRLRVHLRRFQWHQRSIMQLGEAGLVWQFPDRFSRREFIANSWHCFTEIRLGDTIRHIAFESRPTTFLSCFVIVRASYTNRLC